MGLSQTPATPDEALAEEAATWFLRLREASGDRRMRAEFEAWQARSEAHRREYAQIEHLWRALDGARPQRTGRGRKAALAAVVLAGLLCLQQALTVNSENSTKTAERRHLLLADGSEIDLDGDSRLRVEYLPLQRRLVLERGQIFVRVAPGLRPFVVVAGAGRLRDIGTAFNVSLEAGRTAVAVREGRVEVSLPESGERSWLNGGERLDYTAGGLSPVRATTPEGAGAWADGRWQFDNASLAEVVAQLNRQHVRPVRLGDARLAEYRVSGVFDPADRAGLLRALSRLYPLRVDETAEASELRAR